MKIKSLISLIFCFALAFAQAQDIDPKNTPEVIDRLNIPGPLTFDGNEFFLTVSKQNSATWVQQQYFQRDDEAWNYKELINISYFDKEIDLEDAVRSKIEHLQRYKEQAKDKYSFVNITESPDGKEIVVDYMVTTIPKEGEPYADYSFERYKTYDQQGKKSFVIFTYTKRLEGDLKYAAKALSKQRNKYMEAIITTPIPPVTYKPTEVDKKK